MTDKTVTANFPRTSDAGGGYQRAARQKRSTSRGLKHRSISHRSSSTIGRAIAECEVTPQGENYV